MAECEVCGAIVEPGDVVAVEHRSQPHYFCSTFHRDEWRAKAEQSDLAEEALAATLEGKPAQMKVKATMKATGSKVVAEEMAARKAAEEAAAPAEDATDSGTPTPRPTRRRRKKA